MRHRRHRRERCPGAHLGLLVLASALLSGPGHLTAQGARAARAPGLAAPTDSAASTTCWRGRPLPSCRGFFLVEAQGVFPAYTTTREVRLPNGVTRSVSSFESELEWNLGYMMNVREDWAVGGVVTLGTGSSDALTGLRLRARRWLRPDLGAELQAGVLYTDAVGRFAGSPQRGFTADARLNVGDHGSFFLRWDRVALPEDDGLGTGGEPGEVQQAVHVGVATGSTWTVIGTGALGLLYIILLANANFS